MVVGQAYEEFTQWDTSLEYEEENLRRKIEIQAYEQFLRRGTCLEFAKVFNVNPDDPQIQDRSNNVFNAFKYMVQNDLIDEARFDFWLKNQKLFFLTLEAIDKNISKDEFKNDQKYQQALDKAAATVKKIPSNKAINKFWPQQPTKIPEEKHNVNNQNQTVAMPKKIQ